MRRALVSFFVVVALLLAGASAFAAGSAAKKKKRLTPAQKRELRLQNARKACLAQGPHCHVESKSLTGVGCVCD